MANFCYCDTTYPYLITGRSIDRRSEAGHSINKQPINQRSDASWWNWKLLRLCFYLVKRKDDVSTDRARIVSRAEALIIHEGKKIYILLKQFLSPRKCLERVFVCIGAVLSLKAYGQLEKT